MIQLGLWPGFLPTHYAAFYGQEGALELLLGHCKVIDLSMFRLDFSLLSQWIFEIYFSRKMTLCVWCVVYLTVFLIYSVAVEGAESAAKF